jgi:uncharacterized protein
VHISRLADRFVKDPHDVVKVHQQVTVSVLEVDLDRNRISLSMQENPEKPVKREKQAEAKGRKKRKAGGTPKKKEDQYDPDNPFVKALKGKFFNN